MKAAGYKVAAWVDEMIAAGNKTFYKVENGKRLCYDVATKTYKALPGGEAFIVMKNFENETLWKNSACRLYDIGDGICHQVLPEGGHLTSGNLIVGTDTHSTTYGAFNAFGTGIEGSDVVGVMASGKIWLRASSIGGGGKGALPTNDFDFAKSWINHYNGWGDS